MEEYLGILLSGDLSLNYLEVVAKVIKNGRVSTSFIIKYTEAIMQKVCEGEESSKEKQKLARVIIGFIKNLKKIKVLNIEDIQAKLEKFLNEFIEVEEVQQFRKFLV